jgi:Protein of unknown function (DUF2917)
MNVQRPSKQGAGSHGVCQQLVAGQALQLSPWPGELAVIDGRVWLTRLGDSTDHVLETGQGLRLARGEGAVIEAWQPAAGATVRWTSAPQARPRVPFLTAATANVLALLAGLSARAARGLAAAASRFEAWARKAASSAKRAQRCIHVGDSMACGGTVQ